MGLQALVQGLLIVVMLGGAVGASAQPDARRGQYIVQLGGCVGCHTDTQTGAAPFAGGRALKTPFGTFYGPNITPDRETGLGTWSEDDFKRAMRHGERRDGLPYFPAFPYPSFTMMADADLRDAWAYLRSLPPVRRANREHALRFPYGFRPLVVAWKWLFFSPGTGAAAPAPGDAVARGSYLVRALGHCGECHTPRNFLGGPQTASAYAGARMPEGKVPNITPTRLKKWSDGDLREYLTTGTAPSGDIAVEPMSEVITNTTSRLSADDMAAVIAYLRSLAPLPDAVE